MTLAPRRLTYANAGHYPPFLVRGEAHTRLPALTPPVGMFCDLQPIECTIELHAGDWLSVTSDGIPEAFDSKEEEFGDERLLSPLEQARSGTAAQLCSRIIDPATTNSIAWKRGSDTLFLAKQNAQQIQLFELDTRAGSEPVPLGIFVKTFADVSVHPDGRQLAFLDAEWLTEFWRIDGLSDAFAAAVRGSTASTGVRPRPGRSN